MRFKGIALADIWPWRGVVLVMLEGSTGIRKSSQENVLLLAMTFKAWIDVGHHGIRKSPWKRWWSASYMRARRQMPPKEAALTAYLTDGKI